MILKLNNYEIVLKDEAYLLQLSYEKTYAKHETIRVTTQN